MDSKKLSEGLQNVAKLLLDLVGQINAPEEKKPETKVTPVPVTNVKAPEDLSFTELKKYAKVQGVSAVGTREEILARFAIPDEDEEIPDEDEADEDEEEAEVEVTDVEDYVKSLSQEELADILTEAGLSAKGKQPILVARVLKAVEDGDIELQDEDADDDDDDEEEDAEEEGELDESLDDGTLADLPDYTDMSDARKETLKTMRSEILAEIKSGGFTRAEQIVWLQDYNSDKDSRKKQTDKQLLTTIFEAGVNFIGDDGELYIDQKETLYEINGDYFCCGHELDYDEKSKTFTCSVCESEYEAE